MMCWLRTEEISHIKAVIDRLESFDDDTKNKPVTVLLIDSVPMMMIVQS
jgi:hypothetical protein